MKALLFLISLLPLQLSGQTRMWPGDANDDGRVNALDLLAFGLNFGKAGPPRDSIDLKWEAKNFEPWMGKLPVTQVNAGFADSDGDGIVTAEDIEAIELHYDSTQTSAIPPPKPYQPFIPAAALKPRLVFTFDKDTVSVNDTLRLRIFYQHPAGLPQPASPMGVSFRLDFNSAYVKDSLTRVHFEPGTDLMYAAGASGFADARKLPPGVVEFSASGRHEPRLSFSRPLGEVEFIIIDVIVRADTFYTDFKVDVSNVLFLDTLERFFDYDLDIGEAVIFQPVDSFALCPGDANNDGIVNSLDVLSIGLNYKKEGDARKPKYQGMDWAPKLFNPWPEETPLTGINLAFSDSDGDGVITDLDVKAIQLNYDSIHHLAFPSSKPYSPPQVDILVPVPPRLIFDFVQEQVKPGDTLALQVSYVPPEGVPDKFYPRGVAFALEFHEALVQDSLTWIAFPADDDLLAAGAATRFALARGVPPGRVEAGIAGKDAQALTKPRLLCTVYLVIEDPLPPGAAGAFQLGVQDVVVLTSTEEVMLPVMEVDKVEVVVNSEAPDAPFPLRVYPSPVREKLRVESPGTPLRTIEVFDTIGRLVARQPAPDDTRAELQTGHWPAGLYQLLVTAKNNRTAVLRVVKW